MTLTYDYLRERIVNGSWLGKEAIEISDSVLGAITDARNWVDSFPPFAFINSLTDPIFSPIQKLIKELQYYPDVIVASALVSLESIYGINKAFNSRRHNNLNTIGNTMLFRARKSLEDDRIYNNTVEVWNYKINVPVMDETFRNVEAEMRSQAVSIQDELAEMENAARQKLEEAQADLLTQLEAATGSARNRIRAALSRIRKAIETFTLRQTTLTAASFNPIATPTLINPIANPSLINVVGVVNQLASWLLSSFFLKFVVNFPFQLLPALSHTVTSVVCKVLGSAGAEASRYLAGAVLRENVRLLPTVIHKTGTFFGAWSWLSAFAPFIIGAAIIILIAIKVKRVKLGELLYILGTKPVGDPDLAYARVSQMNEEEIRNSLISLATEMIDESRRNYLNLWGFIINSKEEITLLMDLQNLNVPVEVGDETLQQTIWTSFQPFLEEVY